MVKKKFEKTSMNLDENVAGALCYVLGWITGLIFYLLEKDNKFVRFHAMQSILVFLPITILSMLFYPFIWYISGVISLLMFILWIILIIKAYNGEKYKVPIVGDIAENQIE